MVDVYSRHAKRFFDQYQAMRFDDVHVGWLSQLPEHPGFALDVGAGSGRDAGALAERGWEVLAVEPAQGLRDLGVQATAGRAVQWMEDRLPELASVRALSYRFDLILVSAVWMHLAPTQRERAFRILTELLSPGGTLVITLRHGPGDDERTFYDTDRQELEGLARKRALVTTHAGADDDRLQRADVWWETMVFRLPDDGTGALPLLRHIIVNDTKSSTYKLGLLRALTRIADGVPGMVSRRTDDWVELPLGLVALYWIKLYQPLILRHRLKQGSGSRGYGFAKADFHALADMAPMDLRVGSALSADLCATVLRAIRDAARTITDMPVNYTTWPGSSRQIFESQTVATRVKDESTVLDRHVLARFGTFRVPTFLWDCFSRYACWLEPAITNEWIRLMQSYEVRYDTESYYQAMRWEEGRRDTSQVRAIVASRMDQRAAVQCVWSASNLKRDRYDIDHCFPWSRCNNNDLWNLLPTSSRANSEKGEKLPASALLQQAQPRILNWWEEAYSNTPLRNRFFIEAGAALPGVEDEADLRMVFEGMARQRMRLKMNQQLAEWFGVR